MFVELVVIMREKGKMLGINNIIVDVHQKY